MRRVAIEEMQRISIEIARLTNYKDEHGGVTKARKVFQQFATATERVQVHVKREHWQSAEENAAEQAAVKSAVETIRAQFLDKAAAERSAAIRALADNLEARLPTFMLLASNVVAEAGQIVRALREEADGNDETI